MKNLAQPCDGRQEITSLYWVECVRRRLGSKRTLLNKAAVRADNRTESRALRPYVYSRGFGSNQYANVMLYLQLTQKNRATPDADHTNSKCASASPNCKNRAGADYRGECALFHFHPRTHRIFRSLIELFLSYLQRFACEQGHQRPVQSFSNHSESLSASQAVSHFSVNADAERARLACQTPKPGSAQAMTPGHTLRHYQYVPLNRKAHLSTRRLTIGFHEPPPVRLLTSCRLQG